MIDRTTIEPNSSKKAALSNILSSNNRPKIYKKKGLVAQINC